MRLVGGIEEWVRSASSVAELGQTSSKVERSVRFSAPAVALFNFLPSDLCPSLAIPLSMLDELRRESNPDPAEDSFALLSKRGQERLVRLVVDARYIVARLVEMIDD